MKFRLTQGENGTAFGKQKVIFTADAENVIDFVKDYASRIDPHYQNTIRETCWVDAGSNTIPVAVQNLVF